METTRIKRRNRNYKDLKIKNSGGIFDLVDNAMKEVYRITDDEYNYLCEKLSDDEMNLLSLEKLSFTQKKEILVILTKHLTNYYK
jgi:hypothetical protein